MPLTRTHGDDKPSTTDAVPTMTSNNTPEGLCFASSVNGAYEPYYAFSDDGDSNRWYDDAQGFPTYIGY